MTKGIKINRESSRTAKAGATRRWGPRGQEQAARTTAWGECGRWDPREFAPAGAGAISTGSRCQLWRCPQSSEVGGHTLISPPLSLAHFCPASTGQSYLEARCTEACKSGFPTKQSREREKGEAAERKEPSALRGNLHRGRAGRGKPPGGGPQRRTARPGRTPHPSAQGSWKSPLGEDKELPVETSCFTLTVLFSPLWKPRSATWWLSELRLIITYLIECSLIFLLC